ncbi:MAG: gramicidin biosynthesis protein, partial [Alphaproteobacteria bacterium]|nr:gramicidin biosynthesis protein [Alphaproteobacteria bacterium]
LTNLRYIIFGGEVLSLSQLKPWINYYGDDQPKLINMYGITETTVHTTYNRISKQELYKNSYIGKKISDLKAYVLDKNLRPLPIGAVGELYIGGVGLARGYLNRPELTAEKFIANPFRSELEGVESKNTRLYKTGDLVRWLPDGNLEYIGRNDFQVKIRGYRIELGEIESVLSTYAGISQSVVIAKEHVDVEGVSTGNKYLVGYYVSKVRLNEEEIINYLGSRLPEYMIPSILVYLERLPLTINGKLDRKALPDPEFTNIDNYVAPRNELESQVCKIWGEVLGLPEDRIGIRDDFFRLGGDSIVSIQLVSRLRQRLGLNIGVKDIFNYKTIERLYDSVLVKNQYSRSELVLKTEQGILSGEVPLLPIQSWFFENNFVVPFYWNQSFLLRTPDLEIDKLQISINKLIEQHDNLRLRYKRVNNLVSEGLVCSYTQYYDFNDKVPGLKVLDIKTIKAKEGSKEFKNKLNEIMTKWQSGFSLEEGPLYSIGYIHGYADGTARIYFALHHLIVDTVSWRILAEDLRDLYRGKDLGLKGSSYRQWVETIQRYASNYGAEKTYWVDVLSGYDVNNNSTNDLIVNEDIKHYSSLQLSQEKTKQLLRESNRAYHTQVNDILLTAFGYTLYEITGNKVNYIVLEGHGREDIDSSIDVTRTVGWFTTMYPVRLEIGEDIGESIKRIKENLRQVPNRGIGYGSIIGYLGNILPRISFNYLGQFD